VRGGDEGNHRTDNADMNHAGLYHELAAFDRWAAIQPQDEDGWETSYPGFRALIDLAAAAMRETSQSDDDLLRAIARVWSISEETEDLRDVIRSDPARYAAVLPAVCARADWKGRFQIYSLGAEGQLSAAFVRAGVRDADDYVARRALMALASMDMVAAKEEAARFVGSADRYLDKVAREILGNTTQ
jgi:hypothetical protein